MPPLLAEAWFTYILLDGMSHGVKISNCRLKLHHPIALAGYEPLLVFIVGAD